MRRFRFNVCPGSEPRNPRKRLVALSLGYKINTWVGMISKSAGISATAIGTGSSNVIEHGPFVRASYNFGVR